MRSTKSRFALAAVLAALSAPVLADDAAPCSVCDDPTWPALESPARSVALGAQVAEPAALAAADGTWPQGLAAAPSVALAPHRSTGPKAEPAVPSAPTVDYAVVLDVPARRVAAK